MNANRHGTVKTRRRALVLVAERPFGRIRSAASIVAVRSEPFLDEIQEFPLGPCWSARGNDAGTHTTR